MPHTFMNITMNETGIYRAQEYTTVDSSLTNWCNKTWNHAPVELGRHFIAKWNVIWHRFCLSGPKLLGSIKDYAIRYETQSRGSLHVHVILWNTSDEEAALVHQHIVSCIPDTILQEPCHNDHANDYLMHRLATIMRHKNQHSCRYSDSSPRDCLKQDGTCAFHFPVPIHTSKVPCLRAEANRYMYYCPREQDRFTVPTIPEIALLADAHTNVLKVVPGEWSRYMLKYHTKPPAQDSLKLRMNSSH
jgi:hypothetical protein